MKEDCSIETSKREDDTLQVAAFVSSHPVMRIGCFGQPTALEVDKRQMKIIAMLSFTKFEALLTLVLT